MPIGIKTEVECSMTQHRYDFSGVRSHLLFNSINCNWLEDLSDFTESAVVDDRASCSSIDHEFDFKSSIFIIVSGVEIENLQMKM